MRKGFTEVDVKPKQAEAEEDEWDTEADFVNKESIEKGKKVTTTTTASELAKEVRASSLQATQQKTKSVSLTTTAQEDIKKGAQVPSQPKSQPTPNVTQTKNWDPQKEIQGGNVSSAKNRFLQQPTQPTTSVPPKPQPQKVSPSVPQPTKVVAPPPKVVAPPPKVVAPPPKFEPPPPVVVAIVEPPPQEYVEESQEEYPPEEPEYQEPEYQEPEYQEPESQEPEYQEPTEYQQTESYDQTQSQTCEALYDYVPVNEGELGFYAGDVITVLDTSSEDGWWNGELNGVTGYFPSNFVQLR